MGSWGPCSACSCAELPSQAGQLNHWAEAHGALADEAASVPAACLDVDHMTADPIMQAHEPSLWPET